MINLVRKSVYLHLDQLQRELLQLLRYFKEFFVCALLRSSLCDQEIIRLARALPPSSANTIQVVEQEVFSSLGKIF